jgi:putative oxidoreductase
MNGDRVLTLARVAAGLVFLLFGVVKFSSHEHEVDSFRQYGLPEPDLTVYLIGVLEVGGGLLLIAGFLTRLVALALAGNMAVAIVVSGIKEGEVVPSLTLAPALLVIMLALLRWGPGAPSVDASRRPPRAGTTPA